MATQDFIDYSEEDGDDDDVQALLAAIQSKKEKQAKLRKSIRDRANRSQKELKDEAEQDDPRITATAEKMKGIIENVQLATDRIQNLPPLPIDTSMQLREETVLSRKNLRRTRESVVNECREIEANFKKKLRKVALLLETEAVRSRHEDIVNALDDMATELQQAKSSIQTTTT